MRCEWMLIEDRRRRPHRQTGVTDLGLRPKRRATAADFFPVEQLNAASLRRFFIQ
jgi:hypothetical protein